MNESILLEENKRLMELLCSNYRGWFVAFYQNTSTMTARQIDDYMNEQWEQFKKDNQLNGEAIAPYKNDIMVEGKCPNCGVDYRIHESPTEAIKKWEDSSGKETGMKWVKAKPDFKKECVFITRTKYARNKEPIEYDYSIWKIKKLYGEDEDGNYAWYWGLLNGDGEEWGALEDLTVSEYFILDQSVPPYKPNDREEKMEYALAKCIDFLNGSSNKTVEEVYSIATNAVESVPPYKEEETEFQKEVDEYVRGNSWFDMTKFSEEEKKTWLDTILTVTGAQLLKLFYGLGCKTHIEGMMINDTDGKEFVLSFRPLKEHLKFDSAYKEEVDKEEIPYKKEFGEYLEKYYLDVYKNFKLLESKEEAGMKEGKD